jgi:cobalt-precorrin-5B (C1)-methyltransferase
MQDYIVKDNKRLRFGYTTGSCAAGAAKAAAEMLLHGGIIEQVSILTPKGTELNLCVEEIETTDTGVSCYIRKDSGDDPDVTNGIRVYAEVSRTNDMGMIELSGGIGVGRITKPGLACPVGEAAINPVPRRMIEAEVRRVAELYDYKEGLRVTISVP